MVDPTGIANWSVTHVDWSEAKWHPKSYKARDVTFELLKNISVCLNFFQTAKTKSLVWFFPLTYSILCRANDMFNLAMVFFLCSLLMKPYMLQVMQRYTWEIFLHFSFISWSTFLFEVHLFFFWCFSFSIKCSAVFNMLFSIELSKFYNG